MSASDTEGLESTAVSTEVEDRALDLRCQGRSFVAIARELNLGRATGAIAAFTRSLRRRPPAEQERLLGEELHRLDVLADRVRKGNADAPQVERNLRVVARMRALILAG
jgi:hypothetical protein